MRIGFILHGEFVPAWYAETISTLCKESETHLCFLQFSTLKRESDLSFAYQCFSKFEEKWFQSKYDAQKPVSIKELINDHLLVHFSATDGYYLQEQDREKIRRLEFDVIYSIGFAPTDSENISALATFGLWYIHFGYGEYNNSSIPAFWEVMNNQPVIGSYLLMRKNDSDIILLESTTAIVPHSVKNSFNSVAWKSSSFLGYRTRTFAILSDTFLKAFRQGFLLAKRRRASPDNLQMIRLFLKNLYGYIKHKRRLVTDKSRFTLLYSLGPLSFNKLDRLQFKKIDLPDDAFYADPFVITIAEKHYIFFEEYIYSKKKAHISLMETNKYGQITSSQIVLDKPYHLSYPFVFEKEGQYYMIPEHSENKVVSLYKAVNFPTQWEFVLNLIEGQQLIDSTVIFKNGLWWLFATSLNHPFVSSNDQLFLFYSDDLFSKDWKSHPLNPIVTHIGNCRPAGRIFETGNKLFRPAQNNASLQYGYSIVFNEILVLNEKEYVEEAVYHINPVELGLKAIHNIDFTPDILLIDGIENN